MEMGTDKFTEGAEGRLMELMEVAKGMHHLGDTSVRAERRKDCFSRVRLPGRDGQGVSGRTHPFTDCLVGLLIAHDALFLNTASVAARVRGATVSHLT